MKNNTNSVFLWGAALAGVGLYFLLNPNTETQSPGQPAPGGAAPSPTKPKPGSTKPVTTPAAPTPPPVAPVPVTTTPVGETKYVFVDSVLGEGIFYAVSPTKSVTDGFGKERICTLKNGEFAGYRTGKKANGMIQLYVGISGKAHYYWIEEAETKTFSQAGYNDFLKMGGTTMRSGNISLIAGFYRSKGK